MNTYSLVPQLFVIFFHFMSPLFICNITSNRTVPLHSTQTKNDISFKSSFPLSESTPFILRIIFTPCLDANFPPTLACCFPSSYSPEQPIVRIPSALQFMLIVTTLKHEKEKLSVWYMTCLLFSICFLVK